VVARRVQPLGGDGQALSGLLLASSLVLLRVGKNLGFFLNQPSGFFLVFLGLLVFLYICPEERVFGVFSVSRIL
jgi:hypothetical protein